MPEKITANYIDSELKNIRQIVAGKKSEIPFLLLPVRAEARFMKVDKPYGSPVEGALERFLGNLANLEIEFTKSVPTASPALVIEHFRKLVQKMGQARLQALKLPFFTHQQKSWLTELSAEIGRAIQVVLIKLKAASFAPIRNEIIAARNNLTATINSVKSQPNPVFKPAIEYLDQLKKLVRRLQLIHDKKLPYTNPKNKKDLYKYLENTIVALEDFYRPKDDKVDVIRRIKNNQLKRIREFHEIIKKLVLDLPNSIRSIYRDKGWKDFSDRIEKRIEGTLAQGLRHFDEVVLPKLNFVSEIRYTNSDELYYEGIRTLIAVERFNIESEVKGITKVRKTRRKLQKKVETLKHMGQKVVESSPEQVDTIRDLWSHINTSLNTYEEKLNNVQADKASHSFSLKTTINFVNNKARSALTGLTQPSTSELPIFSSLSFSGAQAFFLESTRKLGQLSKTTADLKGDTAKIEEFRNELSQLGNLFRVASRKKFPAAKPEHQTTAKQLQELRDNLQLAGLADEPRINKELKAMEDGIAEASLIIGGKKTGSLDAPIIVATPSRQVNELWVRIFPDDIHVQNHEPALTPEEINDGQRFWLAWWAASDDRELEVGAWRAFITSQGSQRAAWIAHQLNPNRISSNEASLKNKPSQGIQRATRGFQNAVGLLKNLNPDMDRAAMLSSINSAQLLENVKLIHKQLREISFEQKAFLQRAYNELRRLESKLLIIQARLNGSSVDPSTLDPASLVKIQQLQKAFEIYAQVQQHFQKIDPLDTVRFLARVGKALVFPSPARKEKEWSQAPHANVLPDRIAVITMSGHRYTHVAVGNPIPKKLNVGLDPQQFDFAEELDNPYKLDAQGKLQLDEGMRWMLDFEEAVRKGMGLKIPLLQEEAESGFDRVLILGIRGSDENVDQKRLEELIENHHYSAEGMSFLSVGTPTNNTSNNPSGFNSLDNDPEESYRVEMGPDLFPENEENQLRMADGKRLADALGVEPTIFQHIANSDNQEVSQAFAMHRALWHVSIGDYMESSWDHIFTYDNIERTYRFFTGNVVGRGLLPTIRVGTQPYGILPTCAFSRLRYHPNFDENNLPQLTEEQIRNPTPIIQNQLQLRYDIRLKQFLLMVKNFWDIISKTKVKHAYNVPSSGDEGDLDTLPTPQQHFMEMLGLQASPTDYFFRYGINIAYRGPDPEDLGFAVNFKEQDEYGPGVLRNLFADILKQGYFFNSFEFFDEKHPDQADLIQESNRANRIRQQFEKSRIFKSRFLDKHTTISGPIIDTQELSDTNTIERTIKSDGENQISYIQWLLRDADHLYDILARNNFNVLPSNSMLFMLLRQSLLLAYREAALSVMQEEGLFTEKYRRRIGASDRFRLYQRTLKKYVYTSKWTFLFRDLKTFNGLEGIDFSKNEDGSNNVFYAHLGNGERSLADFILNKGNLFNSYSRQGQLQKYRERVDEIREAMSKLDTIPTRALNQLLSEHMGISSYRLDAWLLGFANQRLQKNRDKGKNKGIYLGAYGWLEDLRPGGLRNEAPNLPPELQSPDNSPVFTDADNEGFIHAPSINQAIAAAVLRAGYTASRESIGDLDNQMAVNLSSRRVRLGLSLIEGVKNGQSLGAILGFQFERRLHESYSIAELDRFIYRFREVFPLVVPVEDTLEQTEGNTHANVADGYKLLQRIDTHIDSLSGINTDQSIFEVLTSGNFANCPTFLKSIVDDNLKTDDNRTVILKAIIREIDRIGDALDALGDLVISESVYQVVQGNHVRAAAVVEALGAGKAPPELQFINTPRTGVIVTHRAILHFANIPHSSTVTPIGWPTTMTPRAKAEPSLNKWLGEILGPADQIRCLNYNEKEVSGTPIEIAFSELGMQPVDLLHLLGFDGEQGLSELENRLAWHVRGTESFPLDAVLKISFIERLDSWSNEQKTIYELTPLILHLKKMLTDAKYIDALDIMIPEDDPELENPECLFPEDLQNRVTEAETTLRQLVTDAQTFIGDTVGDVDIKEAAFTTLQLNRLRDFLFQLAAYGIPDSVPAPALSIDASAGSELVQRLQTVLQNGKKRLLAYDAQKSKIEGVNNQRRRTHILIEMGKNLFGKRMLLLPQYRPKNTDAIVHQLNLPADSSLLRNHAESHVLDDWLQGLTKLRPDLYSLDMSAMFAQTFGTTFPDFQPVQFPYSEKDHWLGLKYPTDGFQPEGDYLSLLLFNHQQLTGDNDTKVGIIIDEWTEIIPHREEVTGMAFHYDQPDAQAPQNLLLAVSPDVEKNWTWDNLVYTLNETLDLAKSRAVEPDHLDNSIFAQVLPMILSEVAPPQTRQYADDEDAQEKPYHNPLGTQVVMDFADNLPQKEE